MRSSTISHLTKINLYLGENFIYFIIFVIVLGLTFPETFASISSLSNFLLFFMMFSMALQCSLQDFSRIWQYPKEVVLALAFIYGIIPLLNFGIASLFYQNMPKLGAGQILISAIPPGITASIWTGIAGGNVPFSVTVIFIANLASFFATPGIMHLFAQKAVHVDTFTLMWQLTQIVIFPVVLGTTVQEISPRRVKYIQPYSNFFSKVALLILLLGNTAKIAPYIYTLHHNFFLVVFTVGIQCIFGFALAFFITAKILGKSMEKVFAFTYTSGMRNNGAAFVIAINYFGPIVAIPVVINTLFQQPIASLIYKFYIKK